jgi:hypothetical protein
MPGYKNSEALQVEEVAVALESRPHEWGPYGDFDFMCRNCELQLYKDESMIHEGEEYVPIIREKSEGADGWCPGRPSKST